MVIFLGIPREDAHSLGYIWGLAHCQAQSRLGLINARPSVPGAWHIATSNIMELGTLPGPIVSESGQH